MIELFTKNETLINFLAFFSIVLIVLTHDPIRKLNTKIEAIIAIYFGAAFAVLTFSVFVNGIVKGF